MHSCEFSFFHIMPLSIRNKQTNRRTYFHFTPKLCMYVVLQCKHTNIICILIQFAFMLLQLLFIQSSNVFLNNKVNTQVPCNVCTVDNKTFMHSISCHINSCILRKYEIRFSSILVILRTM